MLMENCKLQLLEFRCFISHITSEATNRVDEELGAAGIGAGVGHAQRPQLIAELDCVLVRNAAVRRSLDVEHGESDDFGKKQV